MIVCFKTLSIKSGITNRWAGFEVLCIILKPHICIENCLIVFYMKGVRLKCIFRIILRSHHLKLLKWSLRFVNFVLFEKLKKQ